MNGSEDPFDRLFERRTVFLRGPLDDEAANRLTAELLTLDATGEGEITLLINSEGGPVECLFPVSDTLALVRSPVATTCLGQASGTAAALVALGTGARRAAARARLSLRVPPTPGGEGTATDLLRRADLDADRRRQLALLVAGATGRPLEQATHDLDHGPFLTPHEAVDHGLVDEVSLTFPAQLSGVTPDGRAGKRG